MDISDEERAHRKRAIDQARANVRLSGTILPPQIEEINRRFIDGEISAEEHLSLALTFADRLNASMGRPQG
jgi:hypothetical protein